MEITKVENQTVTVKLADYEYDTIIHFAGMFDIELEDVFLMYNRSMYNFVIQFLAKTEHYGT